MLAVDSIRLAAGLTSGTKANPEVINWGAQPS
jgi:hypothetical protein